MERMVQAEKAKKEEKLAKKRKNEERMGFNKERKSYIAHEKEEKKREINEKFESIGRKIAETKERKKLYTLKHRE